MNILDKQLPEALASKLPPKIECNVMYCNLWYVYIYK